MKIAILADSLSTQNTGMYNYNLGWIQKSIAKYNYHDYIIIASSHIDELS